MAVVLPALPEGGHLSVGPSACLLLFFLTSSSPGVILAAILEAPLPTLPVTTCSDSSRPWGSPLTLELNLGAEFTMATTVAVHPLRCFSHHDQAHKIFLNSNGLITCESLDPWALETSNCGKIGQAHWGPKD